MFIKKDTQVNVSVVTKHNAMYVKEHLNYANEHFTR